MDKTEMVEPRKKNGMISLVARMLHRSFSRSRGRGRTIDDDVVFEGATNGAHLVPEDVKEGQFAVLTVHDDKPRRFVVPLSCLSHPTFLKLLELAEEEFGFCHEGALAIPCRPSELEGILREL